MVAGAIAAISSPLQSSYRLGVRMARGGMAEVYLGVHAGLGGFEKLVVVKRILPHLEDDSKFIAMLLDEARLAAKLRHPGIVSIVDLERDENNIFSVVMEYLRGESLGVLAKLQRKEKLRIPPSITAYVIAQVADALQFAHTATDSDGKPLHLIHRDVTPANVIVTYDGQPKLIDFGIAKASAGISYTQPGTVKGKFAYGSPEQLSSRPLDARSDVFSLGVVFHELLTAQRLFKGASAADSIRAVLGADIPKPSEVRADIPPAFDAIALRALARDPGKRYPSAAAFRDALNAALVDVPVRRSDVAEWMQRELEEQLQRRKSMEMMALQQVRAGGEPRSDALDLGATSSSGMVGAPGRSSLRPVVIQPAKKNNRLLLILVGVILALLLLLTFFIGRSMSTANVTSERSAVRT